MNIARAKVVHMKIDGKLSETSCCTLAATGISKFITPKWVYQQNHSYCGVNMKLAIL